MSGRKKESKSSI